MKPKLGDQVWVTLGRQIQVHLVAERLHQAVRTTLVRWTDRLRSETGPDFPEKVTAFREGMAVHGRHGEPCPACGAPVQRIRYADNEVNYCAVCQTGGRLLADRAEPPPAPISMMSMSPRFIDLLHR